MLSESFSLYGWIEAVVLALLLQILLFRRLPEERGLLRQHAFIAMLCAFSAGLGIALKQLDLNAGGSVCSALSFVIMGVLLIRQLALALFRIFLPAAGFSPPRIMEDIMMALAYLAWGLMQLHYAGLNPSSLITTSAVLTGIVAFSMQETLGNILGGLALQLDKSIRIGDWIQVEGVKGRVIEVHWRHTAVLTNNGDAVVLPNSLLMKAKVDIIYSAERPVFRRWVYFPVSYPVPPQEIITAIEKAVCHADIQCVAKSPPPQCIVMDYKDGSTIYALRYWLTDPLHDDTTDSVVRMHIYTALSRHGYQLARPCLDTHVTTDNAERDALLHAEEIQQRMQALSCVDIFSGLTETELQVLAESLRPTPFTHGAVMTRQGAAAHWLYLLVSGNADIWYEAPEGTRHHLATIHTGDVFGEMGLMTGEPRSATVTARTDAFCYRLDKPGFESILRARPEIAGECARILGERESQLAAVREDKPLPTQEHEARILANIRRFFGLGV